MLTNFNGTAISYDAIGNPTNWRNTYSMSWDARRLTNQRMNNSDWLIYTYNADGIRTQKYFFNDIEMYGTTHDYVLDGTNIIRETVTGDGNNYTLYYLYDTSGSVQGFIYNNSYYYFQKNLQGDVVRILDYSGNVVVEYTYDAWGKVLSVTGSLASTIGQYNPFRYRSYYYDTETGFYYLQSRYYDPVVGRFINEDRFVATSQGFSGSNMFAYCGNNPVIRKDSGGEWWIPITIIIAVCSVIFTSCGDPNESLVGTPADPAPKTTRYETIKEAVDAAYAAVAAKYKEELRKGNNWEHICAIYEYEGGYYLHTVQTSEEWGKVEVSKDRNVVAEVHTHPLAWGSVFSPEDLDVAKYWQRDSYVLVVGQVNEYDHDKFYLSYKASNCGQYKKYYTAGEISDESEMRVPRIWRYWIHETC